MRSGTLIKVSVVLLRPPGGVVLGRREAVASEVHPQHAALLAVGCYDGTVMVFDVRNKVNKPIYISSIKTGKHTDPVWQVVWQEEDIAKELNFFSISRFGPIFFSDWAKRTDCSKTF